MKRYLETAVRNDLKSKIVLLSGPRQVGKTTMARQLMDENYYLNYDATADRKIITAEEWNRNVELVIFDELHKMKNWKSWIKGIYDIEGVNPALLVTGSARLDIYKKGGESLAGRFFPFRLHPLTVKEVYGKLGDQPEQALEKLLNVGGFPEPYLKNSSAFAKRWRRVHTDTIIRQDLLDLERVRDIKSIEILIDLVRARVGSVISYTSLARDLQVSIHTIKHWLEILENMYILFPVRPYHKNIARSLLKNSKYYLYDTGAVDGDIGAKLENTVACALLRELHYLEDTSGSRVALHFLRNKEKQEVDFLVLIDNVPVQLIEVKTSDDTFAPALFHFHKFMTSARPMQLVYRLQRRKTKGAATMLPVHEYLQHINFS
jgi:predicted AAA+ superfamily ATPase